MFTIYSHNSGPATIRREMAIHFKPPSFVRQLHNTFTQQPFTANSHRRYPTFSAPQGYFHTTVSNKNTLSATVHRTPQLGPRTTLSNIKLTNATLAPICLVSNYELTETFI